jgi:hypothetical protein
MRDGSQTKQLSNKKEILRFVAAIVHSWMDVLK